MGGPGADVLDGAAGQDTLVGLGGVDQLIGGTGNDLFIIDDAGDIVTENLGEGTDEVRTGRSAYSLDANVEVLTYTGTSGFTGTGNGIANMITGGAGDDTLDGGGSGDTLVGGLGNDVYYLDSGDSLSEAAGQGTDEVRTQLGSYTLGASSNLENLTYVGGSTFTGIGNGLANVISGAAGTDSLSGGIGDDTLNGGGGSDTLAGGVGNDVFIVDSDLDQLSENAAEGTDEVRTTLGSYTLGTSSNLENLAFIGTGVFAGNGNGLNNLIRGGASADTLDGAAGADTLQGGAGNDIYLAGDGLDLIQEESGNGIDEVRTGLSTYSLEANVENLTYFGGATLTGTGNGLNNRIVAGAGADTLAGAGGADTLDGGAGADSLVGGTGDDVFIVDDVGDMVGEAVGEGTDEIRTTLASYSVAEPIENLAYTGAGAFSGTGNGLNNRLTGASGADTLDGGAGHDTLNGAGGVDSIVGGTGNDTYVVDDAADVVVEAIGEGVDTVQASVTWTLAGAFENLTLTGGAQTNGFGNALNNVLTGNGAANLLDGGQGDDSLNGGGGADTLVGGAGNDTYTVDNAGDQVTENAGEGVDEIRTTLSGFTLGAEFENLTNIGSGPFSGFGTGAANRLTGGSGNDTLDGGLGTDTLQGGLGDDSYVLEADDTIVELAGQGFDEVRTALSSYVIGSTLEAVVYTGTGAFTGEGNGSANRLTGGTGADSLAGAAGDDTLDGQSGADTLIGGLGNDVFIVDGSDTVVEAGGEGVDEVRTGLSAYTLGLASNLENLTYTGGGTFSGTGNGAQNLLVGGGGADTLIGGDGADTLDGGAGGDSLAGGTGNDVFIVTDGGDSVVEQSGEGTDGVRTTLASYSLTDHVEELAFIGAGGFSGTGNTLDNLLSGAGANDTLSGGDGNDRLVGNGGDDLLTGGSGADRFVLRLGDGGDTVQDFSYGAGDRIELATGTSYTVGSTGGGDAVVTLAAGTSLTLIGVSAGAVTNDWFVTV